MGRIQSRHATPWHRKSWDQFLKTSLPELVGAHCRLTRYHMQPDGMTCAITVGVEGPMQPVTARYEATPFPDERGVFRFDGQTLVIVPVAANETLEHVRSAGEQALDFFARRITMAPAGMVRDEETLRAWLPLGEWMREFFDEAAQVLDTQNPLSETTHLRRLRIESVGDVASSEQIGKTCPFETPEGPNIGKILTIVLGAELRDGRIVRIDSCPDEASSIGPAAALIPFMERNDPARTLMGCNMMRQWIPPLSGEEPLVRTGYEVDAAEPACGFNLLTAYSSFGRLTYEDGLVLSESAARRMRYQVPIEIGDKFSNRHGQKGVVSAILPAGRMPSLPDGRTVECLCSFIGLHTRMNTGQLFEAVYGRLVEKGAADPVVPPFESPSREDLTGMLGDNGFRAGGMERLVLPDGGETERPAVVGPVYWGRTKHIVSDKLLANGADQPRQMQGEMEYWALRNAKAYGAIREMNGILAEDCPAVADAVRAIEQGGTPADPPVSARFARLCGKLAACGIRVEHTEEGLRFAFAEPEGSEKGSTAALGLPEPVAHPWLSSVPLAVIPSNPESPLWSNLVRAVQRLASLLESNAPQTLIDSSRSIVRERIHEYYDRLLERQDFVTRNRLHFSGRSVIVPGDKLSSEQIGLPLEMAWVLFDPFVVARVGATEAAARSERARRALAEVASERWVWLNRAPTLTETAIVGFRPVIVEHRAVEIHPLLCRWINGDFDGDQVAVVHPLSPSGQQAVEESISVIGHLSRDPDFLNTLIPAQDSLWGLSLLSMEEAGRRKLAEVLGGLPDMPDGYITEATLASYARGLLESRGAKATLEILERLLDLGLETASRNGASFDPFMRVGGGEQGAGRIRAQVEESFAASGDFCGSAFGPQLLAVKSGARGKTENLTSLMYSKPLSGGAGVTGGEDDADVRYTACGLLDGFSAEEHFALALEVRRHLASMVFSIYDVGRSYEESQQSAGFNILARAVRSARPGVVVASAAASGEVDPLADLDARLFMGLP